MMFKKRKKISFVMAGILMFVALFGSVSLNAIDVEASNDDRAVLFYVSLTETSTPRSDMTLSGECYYFWYDV